MSAEHFAVHGQLLLAVLGGAVLVAFVRVARGPSLADRVVALDFIGTTGSAIACAAAIAYDKRWPLDVALVLALVSFMATTALAQYITLRRPRDRR